MEDFLEDKTPVTEFIRNFKETRKVCCLYIITVTIVVVVSTVVCGIVGNYFDLL